MTKISHIVSTDLLGLIDDRDFYMCLANIASKDDKYCEFYRKQIEKGAFVLLDNGAAESDQMTLDIMWDVIQKINPSEVILNDCLMDGPETVRRSTEALEFYKQKGYKGQFMFVPQGHDLKEWAECYEMMDKTDISTIGVSKFVTSGWHDKYARLHCCSYINERMPIHLLGCHININEVADISHLYNNIRSNDTAIAYIYAFDDKLIDEGNRPNRAINFMKSELNEKQVELLKKNIEIFDKKVSK